VPFGYFRRLNCFPRIRAQVAPCRGHVLTVTALRGHATCTGYIRIKSHGHHSPKPRPWRSESADPHHREANLVINLQTQEGACLQGP
jgi:hypothetical protein